MAIDQFTDEGTINIKDLTVEIPSPTLRPRFVFERDISDQIWKNSVWNFLRNKDTMDWTEYTETAADMVILFPDRKNELNLVSMDTLIEDLDYELPSYLAELCILYPEHYTSLKKEHAIPFEKLKENISFDDSGLDIWAAFILYPEKWGEIQELPGISDKWRYKAEEMREEGKWDYFAQHKAIEKLLDNTDLKIANEEWDKFLEILHNTESYVDVEFAKNLKILAAKEIKMTPEGLKITMLGSELTQEPVPKMPEGRKF
jgi:hypothetical protein